ncbi:MAG: glycine cleavage system aminomethyltransferase GcvT [Gammaproteobacteria bacterium]|nr:MAG: glycine cleavage system aminomethyltransferase GcvT [Gammaproteobacteria bacterium]
MSNNQTALYDKHLELGAKIVDFAGWDMPLHYGSQLEEHHKVRNEAGMFDVSHMIVTDFEGAAAKDFLRYLLANDVERLRYNGKALYSCMLKQDGGIIDDLIIYLLEPGRYRLVTNAGTRDKVMAWIGDQIKRFDVAMTARDDLSMIAVQGPKGRQRVMSILDNGARSQASGLSSFFATQAQELFIARTGYTGEDGFEIMLPNGQAPGFWQRLLDVGVVPCGLGARDTLRLEAGMNLYGADMDEHTSPLVSALSWTVAFDPKDRDFIGRKALEAERAAGPKQKMVSLVLQGKGVMRGHQKVMVEGAGEGVITSGGFSPTLNRSIALARVPTETKDHCQVDIRGRMIPATVVKPPLVRNGRVLIEL